ncbi:MAG TPA: 6,7-dimethyl-8-ribityllumazine synthase [Bacteroidales bacterium]|nr:6,7-dimethyl-8-ribityllumazine synthase [Bacteroidales bacterium]
MATRHQNLSNTGDSHHLLAEGMTFGIVVADWNQQVTGKLREGAYNTLLSHGARPEDIAVKQVPGSIELTLGAQLLAEHMQPDAVICLGCVVQGETRHFDYVCDSVTQGITELNIRYKLPFIYGILTTENQEQALDRAGGKHGNKGDEAAVAAIRMAQMKRELSL